MEPLNTLNSLELMKNAVENRLIEIGRTIRTERKRRGLTQGELAQVAGLGINFVNQVEAGKLSVHTGKLIQLLHSLGLDLVINAKG